MSIQELANTPIEQTLGGVKFKVQRMSIKEFFGQAQAKIIQDYFENVKNIASSLTGKDKLDWLIASSKEVPKGEALYSSAMEYLATPVGLADLLRLGLNKCQEVSDDKITECLFKATDEEKKLLIGYLSGSDNIEEPKVTDINTDKKK